MVFRAITASILALLVGGCAIGTTQLKVEHAPLDRIERKQQGSILVRQFVDKRKESHEYIGNKRNGFGMVLGHVALEERESLEPLLTRYFAEALAEAGYNAVVQEPKQGGPVNYDAILEGEILEFWLDLYLKVWHNMEVRARVLNPAAGKVLWENIIKADQSNVLWIGSSGEFEKVINESLTKALNLAAKEFAGDAFNKSVSSTR